ncbi:MAG TPA: hypothetical protein VEK05_01180, partial [Burkholderiales bacterium]|nr:hypothetical protein [Burkholderiales bacterium]
KVLPLLSRYEYYSTVKRGFCRGGEALSLTENIRNYFDILARFEEPHSPSLYTALAGTGGARTDADDEPRPENRGGLRGPGANVRALK